MKEHDRQLQGVTFWGRRRFLRQAVTAAGGGVLVVLACEEHGAGSKPTNAPRGEQPASQGYRLTDHIRTYYATLGS